MSSEWRLEDENLLVLYSEMFGEHSEFAFASDKVHVNTAIAVVVDQGRKWHLRIIQLSWNGIVVFSKYIEIDLNGYLNFAISVY